MTTPRTRRTKPQQARDLLLALLKDQEAKAAKHKAAFEEAELRAASTQRVIELLDQAMLPGFETASIALPALTLTDVVVAEAAEARALSAMSLPHGEKPDVNDVWPAPELGPVNHSRLMYSRVGACPLCLKGVPYADDKRITHRVVNNGDSGNIPCTGVKSDAQ